MNRNNLRPREFLNGTLLIKHRGQLVDFGRTKLKVWWPSSKLASATGLPIDEVDGKWFEAEVIDYDATTETHKIQYCGQNNSEIEEVNLLQLNKNFPAWELHPYRWCTNWFSCDVD